MALFSDNHANPPNHRWQNPALKEHFTRGTTHFIEKRVFSKRYTREGKSLYGVPLRTKSSKRVHKILNAHKKIETHSFNVKQQKINRTVQK